jgi:ribose 5-phosphate isomerase A
LRASEEEKLAAARAAAGLIEPGMVVGLGSGSTVNRVVDVLAERQSDAIFVPASPATADALARRSLPTGALGAVRAPDVTIDGADQIDPRGWLIKGGGAAHTREKILAGAAARFVVIASSDKLVDTLRPPVPLEILAFAPHATLTAVGDAQLRPDTERSPDGGLIADYLGPVNEPRELARRLEQTPGVIEHGLFPPEMVDLVIIGRGHGVELLERPTTS